MHTYIRARIRYTLTILLFTSSPSLTQTIHSRLARSPCVRVLFICFTVYRCTEQQRGLQRARVMDRRLPRRRTSLEASRTIYYRSITLPPPSLAVARYTSTDLSIRKWYVSVRGTRTFHRPLSRPFNVIRCSLLAANLALVHPSCFNLPYSPPPLSLSLSLSLSFLSGTRAHGRENNK